LASFVYGSGITYGQYLQADSFVRDIKGQIKRIGETTQRKISMQTEEIVASNEANRHEISLQTREIVASNEWLAEEFGAGFDVVNGTLDFGFNRVENALGNIEGSIENLHSDFNYNMGLILDQLQIQNQLAFGILEKLDAIHKTLKSPRLTQARECYNIGCERLSKGLLDKALEAFLKAEERNDTDFFIEFQIGKLYLYGVDEDDYVIDLVKAEQHLRNAIRYGKAEVSVLPEFGRWTGEALLHASIACYAQANDQQINNNPTNSKEFILKAFQLAQEACEIYPSLSESQYHLAKYAALLGNEEISLENLERVISVDLNYCFKVDLDRDFDSLRPQVFNLFEKMRMQYGEKAHKKLQEIDDYIIDKIFLNKMLWPDSSGRGFRFRDPSEKAKNRIDELTKEKTEYRLLLIKKEIKQNTLCDNIRTLKKLDQMEYFLEELKLEGLLIPYHEFNRLVGQQAIEDEQKLQSKLEDQKIRAEKEKRKKKRQHGTIEELRKQEDIEKRRKLQILEEERKHNGLCTICGLRLSFFDKLRGKKTCSKH
jgi:tetratricopeptide (TPR) repeat protein